MKELQPKQLVRNNPEKTKRLAACRNGWSVIPCERKGVMPKNWPIMANDEVAIQRWDRIKDSGLYRDFAGTGVRFDKGRMLVSDIDVKTAAPSDEIQAALFKRWPEFFIPALRRTSGAIKVAFFGQINPPTFKFARTHFYGDREHVELWGPGRTHYFAVSGPHAVPGRFYDFLPPERAPWTVRLDSLPVFNGDDVDELITICDAILARHLEQMPESELSSHQGETLYDLLPGQLFFHTDGTEEELNALEQRLLPEEGQRGILDRKAWELSERKDHCNALIDRRGRLVITDFLEGVKHRWATDKPQGPLDQLPAETIAALKRLRQEQEQKADEPSPPPSSGHRISDIERVDDDPEETYKNAVFWLFRNMAYCAQAFRGHGRAVISVYPDGNFTTPVSLAALRDLLQPYCYVTVNKNGTPKRHHPIDAWLMLPGIIEVCGTQMRPNLTQPLFTEDGRQFVNHYVPPQHPRKGGEIDTFLHRMEGLIPDRIEREWELNFLAAKVQNPHWRMIAVAMIARETGTGRGLLAQTLGQLLGQRFVLSIPYAKVTGGEGSRFNSELIDALMVCVNEAREADARTFNGRNAAKEALKDFIEPNHAIRFRVEPKGVDAYHRGIATSTHIFSNNIDALPLDDNDRRLAVMLNGPQMTADAVEEYRRWLDAPANLGALYRFLRDFPIEQNKVIFDPFMAPRFHGRALMIEAGMTSLDHAFLEAHDKLRTATELFTMSQLVQLTRHFMPSQSNLMPGFDDLVRRQTRVICGVHRIGVVQGTNWRVRYRGTHDPVYAFDAAGRQKWTPETVERIKKQLDKAQRVVDQPTRNFNKALRLVDEDKP